jgi:hypothetical protein
MNDFIQKQIAASERLYTMMFNDHTERMKGLVEAYDTNASLIKKLEERDKEIATLRHKLNVYEIMERV